MLSYSGAKKFALLYVGVNIVIIVSVFVFPADSGYLWLTILFVEFVFVVILVIFIFFIDEVTFSVSVCAEGLVGVQLYSPCHKNSNEQEEAYNY